MNFLAHTLLGFDDEELICGQICGDFVRGSQLSHFPPRVELGIRLHRHLDVFTDAYPDFQSCKSAIDGVPYRLAGVLIDVMFDHYLALRWQDYSAHTLAEHARRVDAALESHRRWLPESLHRFRVVLSRERLLERNVELAAIRLTLERLSRRSPRFSALAIETSQLQELHFRLQEPFESFYPELYRAARAYIASFPDR